MFKINFANLIKKFAILLIKIILISFIAIYIGIIILRGVLSSSVPEYFPFFLLLILFLFSVLTLVRYFGVIVIHKKEILLFIKKNTDIILLALIYGLLTSLGYGILVTIDVNGVIIFWSSVLLTIVFCVLVFFIIKYNNLGFPFKEYFLPFLKRNFDNIVISTVFTLIGLIIGHLWK